MIFRTTTYKYGFLLIPVRCALKQIYSNYKNRVILKRPLVIYI